MEHGESWAECAAREVLEETGVDLPADAYRFVGATNGVMPDDGLHYITLFVAASAPDGAVVLNTEPDKCEGWEWVPWADVSALSLFIPLRAFIDDGSSPFTESISSSAAAQRK